MVGFCTSPRFVEHLTGRNHPERPDRIRAITLAVWEAGLIDSPNPFADFAIDLGLAPIGGDKLVEIEPVPAEEKLLELVHTPAEIHRVKQLCAAGGGALDEDTIVGPNSYEIALLACGAVLRCCDAVALGNVRRAFAAIRPPGHHAEPERPMGFCLFGNVAIAARYLQKQHGLEQIAIVDFDVHHGNGTQAAFEHDPSVLFVSLHQDPHTCYPGTGFAYEVGLDAGLGSTLNVPLPPGSGDAEYLQAFQSRVLPKLDLFKPQMLLLSAGFDAHRDDPLAQMELSEDGFARITHLLVQAADVHSGGRIVSALEGGYNLRALGRSVVAHLAALR
ncbi:MAG: histone deacetylase [Planctomycetota bacterium]|nr:histone deacetylase [Planctomycetota bacterium]